MDKITIETKEAKGRGCEGCMWLSECRAGADMNDTMIKIGLLSCTTGIIFIKGRG